MICMARTLGAPDTVPAGATASSLVAEGVAASGVSGMTRIVGTGSALRSNVAVLGGALLVCSVPVEFADVRGSSLDVSGNSASVGGGAVFACLPPGSLAAGATARLIPSALPWLKLYDPASGTFRSVDEVFGTFSGGGALYGQVLASPPHVLEWTSSGSAESPVLTRSSGLELGNAARISPVDVFGQAVIDPGITVQLDLVTPATGFQLSGGDRAKPMESSSVVSFVDVTVEGLGGGVLEGAPQVTVHATVSPARVSPVGVLRANISACVPGFGRRSLDGAPIVCGICLEGTYSADVSIAPCVSCDDGASNFGNGATSCDSCPAGTERDLSALNTTDVTPDGRIDLPCTCSPGFYSPQGKVDMACVACPEGGVCDGKLKPPYAQPGFYPGEGGGFVSCKLAEACAGDGRCSVGYDAQLCADCASGYYKLSDKCHKCANTTAFVLIAMIVLAFVLVFALIYFNTRKALSYRFAAAMIGLNSLQISAIYGRIALDWGEFANARFSAISFLNLNFDLAAPECASEGVDVYMLKWWGTMLLPVMFCIPFGVVGSLWYVYIRKRGGQREAAAVARYEASGCNMDEDGEASEPLTVEALKDAMVRSFYQLLVLLYLPLTGMCMSYFGCNKGSDGRWALDVAPSRTCFTSSYWAVFPFAVLFFGLYCLAIPLGIFMLLYKRNAAAQEDAAMGLIVFQLRYGFLVARFQEQQYYFETFIMLRKFGVVAMTTFFYSAVSKADAALVVLGASFLQLCLLQPYLSRFHNILAMVCLGSCAAVLEGGTIEDGVFRGIVVVTAIVVNTLAIFVGNGIDLWLMRKSEAEAEDEFYESGQFRVAGDAAVVDDKYTQAEAEGRMTTDTELRTINGNGGGAMHTIGVADSPGGSSGSSAVASFGGSAGGGMESAAYGSAFDTAALATPGSIVMTGDASVGGGGQVQAMPSPVPRNPLFASMMEQG